MSSIIKKKVIIKNRLGLHARPAALFVQLANKFESDISIRKEEQGVNGKSIMGVMMLAAGKGDEVEIEANGKDARKAVEELEKLLMSNLEG